MDLQDIKDELKKMHPNTQSFIQHTLNDSKLDELAEKVVSDLIRNGRYSSYPEDLAANAYKIASAMLKESEYYRARSEKEK